MENHSLFSRRNFLKTSVAVSGALVVPSSAKAQPAPAVADATPLPMRQLGKSGPQVTMVSLGGMMNALSPEYLDIAWSMGVRYFDTADCYLGGKSEKIIGEWLKQYPERRKDIFLVSKDHPGKDPEKLLEQVDKRLAACGTDYLDLFFIHGIGPKSNGTDSLEWPKSDQLKKVVEQLKSSGKCKMVGFSCHDARLVDYLNAAAEGGFVDAIMLAYNPFFEPGGPFDQAMDACQKAGIGLIAMKTMRGLKDVPKRLPEFDKLGLTTHQALLHAVWSDPRVSAVCSMINNVGEMEVNTGAARSYKEPLKAAHRELLKETLIASRRSYCPGCPSCDAFAAGTALAFGDISRYVTYYEQDGDIGARDQYQALAAAARDCTTADLEAMRDGCAFGTDYPEIMRRAQRYFS